MGDSGFRSLHQMQTESTTGANGLNQIAYSFDLGNGARLTVGADERRVRNIWAVGGNNAGTLGVAAPAASPGVRIGGSPGANADESPGDRYRAGQHTHSPFLSLMLNQAWGTAGIAVVAQENRATQYTNTGPGCAGVQAGSTDCAHPDDKWAWGARAGAEFKLPMFGPGDRLLISGYYSEGAVRLTGQNLSSPSLFRGTRSVAIGWVTDEVYQSFGGVHGQFNSTTAWSINAGYEHYWTPAFSTGIYGGYIDLSYNDTVINNRWFCSAAQVTPTAGQACDPGFALYHVGFLTNWFPAPGFRLALDVLYTGVETAMEGTANIGSTRGLRPTGAYTLSNRGITSVMFRAQRNWGGN
jgi:hypothetical protein